MSLPIGLFHVTVLLWVVWGVAVLLASARRDVPGPRIRRLALVPATVGAGSLAAVAVVPSYRLADVADRVFGGPLRTASVFLALAVAVVFLDSLVSRIVPAVVGRTVGTEGRQRLTAVVLAGALAFPAVGLGVITSRLERVSAPADQRLRGDLSSFASVSLPGVPMALDFDGSRSGYIALADGRILRFELTDEAPLVRWRTVFSGLGQLRGAAVAGDRLLVSEIVSWPCPDPPVVEGSTGVCRPESLAGGELRIIEESSARVIRLDIGAGGRLRNPVTVVDRLPVVNYQHAPNGLVASRGELFLAIGNVDQLWRDPGRVTGRIHPRHDLLGTVLRFNPDGSGQRVFARGLRNIFALTVGRDGALIGVDNDGPIMTRAGVQSWRGEEVVRIHEGDDLGFPVEGSFGPFSTRTRAPLWVVDVKGSAGVEWAPRAGLETGVIVGACGKVVHVRFADDGLSAAPQSKERTPVRRFGNIAGCVPVVRAAPDGRVLIGTTGAELLIGRLHPR